VASLEQKRRSPGRHVRGSSPKVCKDMRELRARRKCQVRQIKWMTVLMAGAFVKEGRKEKECTSFPTLGFTIRSGPGAAASRQRCGRQPKSLPVSFERFSNWLANMPIHVLQKVIFAFTSQGGTLDALWSAWLRRSGSKFNGKTSASQLFALEVSIPGRLPKVML
jgi:hypothetical protein